MLNYSHKAQAPERGGKKLSRSEAARHASLVRWKKESPFAANVMERLAQIRAARLKKGKGKGKGGKGKAKAAKPQKDARTPQEKANQNRAAIAKETGMANLEGTMTRLSVGMSSDQEAAAYEELTKRGLAKTLPNGKTTLTSAGKKWKRAADKGDAAGAKEALAEGEGKAREGADKETARQQKKAEREKARAERAAAREQRKAGGKGKGKKPPVDDKEKAAASAQREKERQEDRAMRLADRAQRQKERAEDRTQRAKERVQREKERAEDRTERKKDKAARDAERTKKQAAGTAKEKAQRQRDIEQEVARITAARARKGIAMDEITAIITDMQATITELTEVAAEDYGAAVKSGRRNNTSDQATINEGYALSMQLCDLFESLGADTGGEEEGTDEEEHEMMGDMEGKGYTHDGDAVKALDGDRVGAYAVRFGSEQEPDMSPMRDYFTKTTDYWLDAWDRRPMLFHHAMDADTDDAPRIGTWTKAEVKDEGVWLEGQLDKAHRYYGAIKELVRRGVLRLSSDSAPHLVRRATKAGGIHEVTRWPLLAASLTPTPAEPRLTAVSFKALIAELGIDDKTNNPEAIHESGERSDETKAADERARRLLLLRTRILQLQE